MREGHLSDPRCLRRHQRRTRPAGSLAGARSWHEGSCGVVLVILTCPPGARLRDRRDPGHLGAPVVPTPWGICSPRWSSRTQPLRGNPGAHHCRPARRHQGHRFSSNSELWRQIWSTNLLRSACTRRSSGARIWWASSRIEPRSSASWARSSSTRPRSGPSSAAT